MYGRVGPGDAVRIADAYRDGRVELEHYRGRTCFPGPVQAAEAWLRARTDSRSLSGVVVLAARTDGEATEVDLELRHGDEAGTWRLRLTAHAAPPRAVSCGKSATESPTYYGVTEAERVLAAQDAR
jgi:hypothetical protein